MVLPRLILPLTTGAVALTGLYLTTFAGYLLFHSLAELYSIAVASAVFIIAWNSRRYMKNPYLVFIGIAYLFIAVFDLLHTLSYKGMGVFPAYDANLPTQLWIAARYLESVSLLFALQLSKGQINHRRQFTIYTLGSAILVWLIFQGHFPDCYLEGSGLTLFKKISEYLISLILLGSLAGLYRRRATFDRSVFRLLVLAIILTIGAELAFTFYISVYGFSNYVGHVLKIFSFMAIYKAIVETGITRPLALTFRELSQANEELRQAMAKIKILSGLLPICSACKKIRDDRGYWKQLEAYIREHSEAEFSHGICPECAAKLYPGLFDEIMDSQGQTGGAEKES